METERRNSMRLYEDEYETPTLPSRTLSESIQRCTSIYQHLNVPGWLIEEKGERSDFQKLIHRKNGKAEMLKEQRAFLAGFDDQLGGHWCGLCFWRCRFVNAGVALAWPDLHTVYSLPETHGVVGRDAWLQLAREANDVLVISIVQTLVKGGAVSLPDIDPRKPHHTLAA
jgi:hypothetical protein